MIYIRDLIRKKRYGQELTEEEMNFFVEAYNNEEILKEQAAALLTLMYTNGVTSKEMAYLTKAIAETGTQAKLYNISNKIVDIHPIGGMDDKIVIILNAIISSLGIPITKIVGRERGILDKLTGVAIYNIEEDFEKIRGQINNGNMVIIEEPCKLAPVENKFYKLRNDIACNDAPAFIAMNVMSQKYALGIKNVIFDISFGESTYVKSLQDAKKLAKYLVQIGNELEINVQCVITKLSEPVGKFFGNTIEVEEILDALKGNMIIDVGELVLEIGNLIFMLINHSNNIKQNKQDIMDAMRDDSAYNQMFDFLQSNNQEFKIIKAKNIVPVTTEKEGYIEEINMSDIRVLAKDLNAIRYESKDKLDLGAGIEFCKKIGDPVINGEIIGYIHTNDEKKVEKASKDLEKAFIISNKKVKDTSRIVEVI